MAASQDDSFEFLYDLLDEFEREREAANNASFLGTPDPEGNEEIRRIKASLVFDNPAQVHLLPEAQQWWRKNGAPLAGRDRFVGLYHLLNRLDHAYAREPAKRIDTARGSLLLGARWWLLAARELARPGQAATNRPPLSAHRPFRHLRKLPSVTYEWIEVRGNRLSQDRELRVGLCSLSGRSKTQFRPTRVIDDGNGVHGFRSTGVATVSESDHLAYINELRDCVHWARDNGVHVLCFPELCVCQEGREAIRAELQVGPGALGLIVPGSFHCVDANGVCWNDAPVWASGYSELASRLPEVGRALKHERFDVPLAKAREFPSLQGAATVAADQKCGNLGEDIALGNRLCLLDTDAGVFGVLICKDVIGDPDYVERCAQLADHLLIVAMNASPTDWFWQRSRDFRKWYGTATFYVNCAQFLPDQTAGNKIFLAFVQSPLRDGADSRAAFRTFPDGDEQFVKIPANGRLLWSTPVPLSLRIQRPG